MSVEPALFDSTLLAALKRWDLPIDALAADRLRRHFQAMIEANRTVNLTRITDPVQAAVKHYADSLSLLCWVRERSIQVRTVLDVGTGAGFPAVPLAIMRPDWSITAIDATRKKVDFVARTAAQLGLLNLRVEHAHSSHWQSGQRFDVVTARALTSIEECLQEGPIFLAPGGRLVAYKTRSQLDDEIPDSPTTARKLGLIAESPHSYELQLGTETLERVLVIYRRAK